MSGERITCEVRARLIEAAKRRDGPNCWLCGGGFEPSGALRLTLEHLEPRSQGGSYASANIAVAHEHCNLLMGDMTRRQKVRFRRGLRFAARPSPLPTWHKSARPDEAG